MYKKIMVPLDGSKLAECVFPHVDTIAGGCEAKSVVFVRVVTPVLIPAAGEGFAFTDKQLREMEAMALTEAKNYLSQVASRVKYNGIDVETKVLAGSPADRLAEYAAKNNVDLIIIASHGRSGISRWVWGSVADRMLRSACVPVLMIRAPGCVPGI